MIGKNIYELRKKRGLTLSELAERAVISKSYLSNIERNSNANPSIYVLEQIAGALQVDLQELLKSESELEAAGSLIEKEWLDFIHELKENGIRKENIQNYKVLVEFIKWHQENK
jgi:XRE family transcriptional regulator, master regulator for biofilm formation